KQCGADLQVLGNLPHIGIADGKLKPLPRVKEPCKAGPVPQYDFIDALENLTKVEDGSPSCRGQAALSSQRGSARRENELAVGTNHSRSGDNCSGDQKGQQLSAEATKSRQMHEKSSKGLGRQTTNTKQPGH